MTNVRRLMYLVAVLLGLLPAAAFAQASIVGAVRDSSGGVLPGVTVEAASPALIEKVRVVTTDGSGQYRIVDLRPGSYSVTFTLPGFNTVKREGVVLAGSLSATVNADLQVGALSETLTVTGESPIVDVQNATQQRVMDKDVLDALPTGRLQYNVAVLIPGVSPSNRAQQDVGGSNGDLNTTLTVHGSRAESQRISMNGLSLTTAAGGGQFLGSSVNMGAVQEVAVDTAAASAEQATGGVQVNFIPRDGGNRISGSFYGAFANDSMQGSNFTQDLKDRGLGTPGGIIKNWDVNPGVGGPFKKDKLWFYVSVKHSGADSQVPGAFVNLNANKPDVWTYAPGEPAQLGVVSRNATSRLTWQINQKNKLAFTWEASDKCGCRPVFNATATRSPEAGTERSSKYQRMWGADWSAPITSRLLLSAAFIGRDDRWGNYVPEGLNPQMISVTEQSTGLVYRAFTVYNVSAYPTRYWKGTLAYITGTHAFKVGYNDGIGSNQYNQFVNQPVSYRFNNGVPNQITQYAEPFYRESNMDHDLGFFAQDKWTLRRLTVSAGVRYDHFVASYPEQKLTPSPMNPTRNITFPAQEALNMSDVTPKLGAVYDLFGDGKTSLKVSLNKYLAGLSTGGITEASNPVLRLANTTTRSWNDANRDYVPQCDLLNFTANGECGASTNQAFGTLRAATNYDQDVLKGWGNRGFDWEFSTGIQREVLPRVSVDVGYFRRWYGNFQLTDNRAVKPSDYDPFSITAPQNSLLPGGGGYVIGDLFDLKPSAVGLVDNIITLSDKYGKQTEHWNGVDLAGTARVSKSLILNFGISTGRTSIDRCDVVVNVDNPSKRFCATSTGFLTQAKGYAAYTVPKIDVSVSGTFQSLPGPEVLANYTALNAQVAPSLGRPLSGGAANVTVGLVDPGAMHGERLNQVDLRFGKVLRFGTTKSSINLDLYNALNGSAVITQSDAYATWQRPQQILTARFAKISMQFDF